MTKSELQNKIATAQKIVDNDRLPANIREGAKKNISTWQTELKNLETPDSKSTEKQKRKGRNLKKRSKRTRESLKSGKKFKLNKSKKTRKSGSSKTSKTRKNQKEKLATPPAWLLFIRKFVTYYANKSVKVETLTKFTEALQDKFQANPKRAATPNIEDIRLIQEILVKAVNSAGRKEKVKVEVSDTYLSVMKSAIRDFTVARGNERVYPKYKNEELSGLKKKYRRK